MLPARFLVMSPVDEDGECDTFDVETEAEAREWYARGYSVSERFNFVDETPAGDPPGLLWDYATRLRDFDDEDEKGHP